jgi:hypothetical protein
MSDAIAGTPAPKPGDRVEVVQRAVGRFKGPVIEVDDDFLTLAITMPTGKVRETRIARKSILKLTILEQAAD